MMAHKEATLYTLPSLNILKICGDDFTLYNKAGQDINLKSLPPKKAALLKKLLENANELVSYKDLFESYSETSYSIMTDLTKVTHMIDGIDKRVGKHIKVTPKEGYTIEVKETKTVLIDTSLYASIVNPDTKKEAISHSEEKNADYVKEMVGLEGSYIGFYLDRKGSGSLFGVYLHIDNLGSEQMPDMRVHAILGIQSDTVLFGKELADIFSEKQDDYTYKFAQFREKLPGKDKECFIGTGTIIPHKAIVEMTFRAITDEEWHVFMDLQGYLADNRPKEYDTDNYRGGLGLAFAFWSEFGDMCFRFAFVRTSLRSSALSLDNNLIKDKLKVIAHGQGIDWRPVELSSQLDKSWYNWFMKEYRYHIAIHSRESLQG